jgi:hypothetical protein
MKQRFIPMLSVMLCLLSASAGALAQLSNEVGSPPPPPEGQFFFGHERFLFRDLKPVSGAPFSAQATTETLQTLADGNQIKRTQTAMLFRDSAGRTRREETISSIGPWAAAKGPHQMVNISDPVAGASYMLDPTTKTAVKLPTARFSTQHTHIHAEHEGAPSPAVSTFARTTESLGTQQIAGVSVEGTRTTETIPAGAIGNVSPIVVVSERWYSPELQMTIYSKRIDPRFGTTIYQVTNISRQEPASSLFQVPSDYAVTDRPSFRHRAMRVSP